MIIKIDHLSFSSKNTESLISFFKGYQYTTQFEETLTNLYIKKNFLTIWDRSHTLYYLEKKDSVPIEITDHGSIENTNELLFPIIQKKEPVSVKKKFFEGSLYQWYCSEWEDYVYCSCQKGNPDILGILIQTNNLKYSNIFWQKLGFIEETRFLDGISLSFTSIFNNSKFYLYLKTSTTHNKLSLNSKGLNCISMLSTNIYRDIELLSGYAKKISAIDTLKVNKKEFLVCFCAGPSGELIELISICKQSGGDQ